MRTALSISLLALLSMGGATAQEEASSPSVGASAICVAVEEHEPVQAAESFPAGVEQLFCWTRIEGGEGSTIVHAWIHEGTTRARIELTIGSDRWRTFSSKKLLPAWTGAWEVKVLTPEGAVLASIPFTIGESAEGEDSK